MGEAASDRPIQWDTERYVIDTEPTCAGDDECTPSEEVKVAHLFGVPALAQELFDKGLIFMVNQAVLHHYGYAIGVAGRIVKDEVGVERFAVDGLCLHKSSDPEGIWFDEATVVAGRKKMRAAGLLRSEEA